MPTPTTAPEAPATYLDSTHPVVARLIELQADQSDAIFAARWLSLSATTWFRIKQGSYGARDHSRVLEKLEGGLAAIEDERASRANSPGGRTLQLTGLKTGLAAVRRAFGETRDRLVVILAPTGGGKTTFARALEATYPGRVSSVEATETWRTSYLAAIHVLGQAIGLPDLSNSTRLAEAALLDALRARPRIICIDEGHYFGAATINLIKAILNQTGCTVVLLAIPALWSRIKRSAWEESEQLRTRTCALVEARHLSVEDAQVFLADRLGAAFSQLNDEAAEAARLVANAGNEFGLLDTAERIAAEASTEAGTAPLTLDIIKAAIRNTTALRR